jgi:hypothetical protein
MFCRNDPIAGSFYDRVATVHPSPELCASISPRQTHALWQKKPPNYGLTIPLFSPRDTSSSRSIHPLINIDRSIDSRRELKRRRRRYNIGFNQYSSSLLLPFIFDFLFIEPIIISTLLSVQDTKREREREREEAKGSTMRQHLLFLVLLAALEGWQASRKRKKNNRIDRIQWLSCREQKQKTNKQSKFVINYNVPLLRLWHWYSVLYV